MLFAFFCVFDIDVEQELAVFKRRTGARCVVVHHAALQIWCCHAEDLSGASFWRISFMLFRHSDGFPPTNPRYSGRSRQIPLNRQERPCIATVAANLAGLDNRSSNRVRSSPHYRATLTGSNPANAFRYPSAIQYQVQLSAKPLRNSNCFGRHRQARPFFIM